MTSSLVGSEMCIRDRRRSLEGASAVTLGFEAMVACSWRGSAWLALAVGALHHSCAKGGFLLPRGCAKGAPGPSSTSTWLLLGCFRMRCLK
eukprot:5129877-Prorocentrum_lima.AAC.1